ncbi:MAG: radical SAM family heme chaperone HemW, partial [Armatimonadota bacterium]|nr:radical SAM family heme chaperone HemW [Armatimonadota bacterium]
LSVPQLGRILDALRQNFGIRSDAEVTIEANPRTHVFSTPGELEQLQEQGINRLSIGAQTFDDNLLRLIGRDHDSGEVGRAVERARSAGIRNLSLDLIFALPGQTLKGWEQTLHRALELETEHISLYNLTIEEGTVFGERHRRGEMEPAPSDLEADMYEMAIRTLSAAGYTHYEVSNFARPGFESRHNQVYWKMEDYLGLGVGAHSCLRNVRFANGRQTLHHIEAIERGELPLVSREELPSEEALSEAMWLGLRLLKGVDLQDVERRFGADPAIEYRDVIHNLVGRGLVRLEDHTLSLTEAGLFLGNEVFCSFA